MNKRSFFSLLALVFSGVTLLAQPGSAISYKSFMRDYQSNFDAFNQSGAELSAAAAAHIETIESIFREQGIELDGDKKRDNKRRQNLYDWMVRWAPIYGTAYSRTPEELEQNIDVWIRDFSDEFGLTSGNLQKIRKNLTDYIGAYIRYQADYDALQKVLLLGNTPPPVPPPPPAPQQHHTSG